VPRRVSLPGADELFRRTRFPEGPSGPDAPASSEGASSSKPSGRVRHDEKITIYVTSDELLTLEHTRLTMRAHHGVTVDRGRIVREAIHLALQDVADHGDESALVRRLREQ
jgi:hypothetical protein